MNIILSGTSSAGKSSIINQFSNYYNNSYIDATLLNYYLKDYLIKIDSLNNENIEVKQLTYQSKIQICWGIA